MLQGQGRVVVFDRRTGAALWRESGRERGTLAGADRCDRPSRKLYFKSHSPFTAASATVVVSAVDPRTGTVVWTSPELPGSDLFVEADPRTGTVAVNLLNGDTVTGVRLLDARDGHALWTPPGGDTMFAGPWLLSRDGRRLLGYRVS